MSTNPPRRPRAEELHDAHWRRSSYSGGANDCVEIAALGVYAAVRDSKAPELSPVIFSRSALDELLCHFSDGSRPVGVTA
ncbi:DUF397 domain-containing protein [Streptomyces sp. NPDC007126]|uniref:DUF397 domain-containing protein n=1 Tax=Streptomyces sp. NPDC007126 TaxID=3364774 RepID=UPI0036C32A4A